MKSVVRFSMKNSVAVFIVIAVLIASGLYSIRQMKMEKYPQVDIPYLHLNIVYPGASPEQVMNDIGKQLEQELGNIKGINNVYSGAYPNAFWATVEFPMTVDLDEGEREVRDAVAKIKLPDTAKAPEFRREAVDEDLYKVAFYGQNPETLQHFADTDLLPSLHGVKGINRIDTSGLDDKQIYIQLRPDALEQYHVSLEQVNQLIAANNFSMPVGDLTTTDQKLPIRVSKTLQSVSDVNNIRLPIPNPGNVQTVKLSEIADVTYESKQSSITRMNGQPAVIVSIVPEAGEDAVKIAKKLKQNIADLQIPSGVKKQELLDRSAEIEQSVNSMLREVLLGSLMAVIVTLLFLRNLRSTIIAVISIPLSMFASFTILNYLGYTLNMMTLAGIAVAVGRVVDDSIVVIENIFRRVRLAHDRDAALVENATREVSSAITSSTMTTVAVFLPLAFVPGIIGKFFVPLAWTVVVSLLFSLLVAVSVVPLMSRLFLLKLKHAEPRENAIQKVYRKSLQWSLGHRAVTLFIAIALLAGSCLIIPKLGFNFLPSETVHNYSVNIKMPIGTSIAVTDGVAGKVEQILRNEKEVDVIGSSIYSESAWLSFSVKNDVKNPQKLADRLRNQFDDVTNAKSITLVGIGGVGGNNMSIVVNGPNIDSIKKASEQMVSALKQVPGLADVRSSAEGEKPEIAVQFDEQKLADHALTPAMVASSLHQLVEGSVITRAPIEGKTTDVVVKLKMADSGNLEMLENQKIKNMLGMEVSIKDIGRVEKVMSPTNITHLNEVEYLEVYGTITNTNTGKVSADADKALSALDLPKGVTYRSEGASKEMNEGFKNMGIALLISIILVYLVMLIAFGEPLVPFVILFAIPFSIIGALAGLFIVGEPVGMPAMIGVLMLNGIVVTNAIVLLERVKQNLKAGLSKHDALLEAGATRVRPILMTAIATMGALLPLAMSTEAGLISRSLAVVVIGGLCTSTLLTLIIVPVLFSLFSRGKKQAQQTPVKHVA